MAINKNYLNLEFGSGKFFDYSKEKKEDYVEHTSSKGNTSYRKYYEEVEGILESVSVYDGSFGQQISMNIKNGEEVYYVPVDLYDQRGNVATYAESLIKILPHLEKGKLTTVRGYNFTPDGEKYAKIGISIKVDGVKIKPEMTNAYYKNGKLVEGDIPAIEWVEKLGKNKPSASSLEKKDDYLLGVLEQQTERLKWEGSQEQSQTNTTSKPSTSVPKASPKEAFEPAGNYDDDDMSDLPFG